RAPEQQPTPTNTGADGLRTQQRVTIIDVPPMSTTHAPNPHRAGQDPAGHPTNQTTPHTHAATNPPHPQEEGGPTRPHTGTGTHHPTTGRASTRSSRTRTQGGSWMPDAP